MLENEFYKIHINQIPTQNKKASKISDEPESKAYKKKKTRFANLPERKSKY